MKLFLSLLIAVLLASCSLPTKNCSTAQIQYIRDTNIALIESKERILGYESGKPIPGILYSSLSKSDLINAYKEDYNKSVTRLEAQVKQCNLPD
jgi:hypothetical protein